MPSIRFASVAGFALLSSICQLVLAVTEVRLLPGVCDHFPGVTQSSTGNSFVGQVNLRPLTGTYIDKLDTRFGGILEQQRMVLPWYTVSAGYIVHQPVGYG